MAKTICNIICVTEEEVKIATQVISQVRGDVAPVEIGILAGEPVLCYRVAGIEPEYWATALRLVAQGVPITAITPQIIEALKRGFQGVRVDAAEIAARFVPASNGDDAESRPATPPVAAGEEIEVRVKGLDGNGVLPPPSAAPRAKAGKAPKDVRECPVRRVEHSCGHFKTHRLKQFQHDQKAEIREHVKYLQTQPCRKCIHGLPVALKVE